MIKANIDFRKQRDFGEVLNATFAFFRLNIGSLGKVLLFYLVPFLILQGLARVYFDQSYGRISNIIFNKGMNTFLSNYLASASVLLFTSFLSTLSATLTVYSYIKAYTEKSESNTIYASVWRTIRRNFFRVFVATLITYLFFIAGIFMCVVPGIYLYVSMSFVIIIIMYEGKPFGRSLKRSFGLAHYQWWSVFLLLLVMYFILYIVNLVFGIPETIIKYVYTFNSMDPNNEDTVIKYVMIVITMLSTLAWGFLYCIMYIALSFKYFSIVEKKESPGLLKEIEELENSSL